MRLCFPVLVRQYRTDNTADTVFTKFVDQDIDMCVTAVDDLFLCTVYHFRDDADATVAAFFHAARHFIAQGIHQPWLTLRSRPDHRKTGFIEFLARSGGMLQVERTAFFTDSKTRYGNHEHHEPRKG